MSLQQKTAIVTGSTSGIGEATARALAAEGIRVIVTGRNAERGNRIIEEINANGSEALFVQGDLSDRNMPIRLVDMAQREWGRLDMIVNNAALVCNKPIESVTHGDWDRLFEVNVKAGFFLVQAALPLLRETKGNIVNVSSINGLLNDKNNLVYDVMKAALNHMTRGLAMELRGEGIRVNALLPAGVATPLLDQWLTQALGSAEQAKSIAQELMDAPNVGKPWQIADAVLFLLSDRASWINGAVIPIEGGYSIGHPAAD
ncbi:SDR family NAD(P)-dependent oxidoreductase [Cohnella terricola]|uniref:SDR family oxidoreductase n=1 Tax=Cohnella terricola TaxID=1289167 RepID=A0A559JWM7_9BACL|nr:SDR family oxidoreductase [Cohnella terricola]TVY04276.1 SDR family oxidoreductase [Cohnella terricola]